MRWLVLSGLIFGLLFLTERPASGAENRINWPTEDRLGWTSSSLPVTWRSSALPTPPPPAMIQQGPCFLQPFGFGADPLFESEKPGYVQPAVKVNGSNQEGVSTESFFRPFYNATFAN
jgi:hypothetical protein